MTQRRVAIGVAAALCVVAVSSDAGAAFAWSTPTVTHRYDPATTISVTANGFTDGYGRQVVLRGFNVSGETKLAEHGGLPFADVADAQRSAAAMKQLTGANAVRFLLSWAAAEPVRGQVDPGYLAAVTGQIAAFADQGFAVLLDYHQDLWSRYLFDSGSWYTGDGAPKWTIDAGGYPKEYCGVCVNWGQNITQNAAVQDATADFWHDRLGFQDDFLDQAQTTMAYLRDNLGPERFARILGMDPLNEPYAGRYDAGQDSQSWERDVLWPFYLAFRARMDAAGWAGKPAFVEPNMFWNANLDFERQPGGLVDESGLAPRFVFNSHFYDEKAISGVLMWGKAADGQYTGDFGTIRQRASALGTAALVGEFGSPASGYTADKTPTVLKAMYQGLDSGVSGAQWWAQPAASGPVLSGTQWQWDIYSGRHQEPMNGNPAKVQTTGDAWNGEDFSVVATDDAGTVRLRPDARLVDRVYPAAVDGQTVAFTYEDRSRDGSATLTWNPVPAGLPNVRAVVGAGRYAVLVWRGAGGSAPTELQLPADLAASSTVVSDAGSTVTGRRLLLTAGTGLHVALVAEGTAATDAQRAAARAELAQWAAALS